jgi:hypothetical protein
VVSLVKAGDLVLSKLSFCNLFSNISKHLRCRWKAAVRKPISIRNKHPFLHVYELLMDIGVDLLSYVCLAFMAPC